MKKRPPHDFTIDVMQRPDTGATVYVARCLHGNGCTWNTRELSTRAKAVTAAHWHQINEQIQKL